MKPANKLDKRNVPQYLRGLGCQVLRVTARKSRAVIEIADPNPQLQEHAASITENINGQQRQTWFVHVNSCLVYWH